MHVRQLFIFTLLFLFPAPLKGQWQQLRQQPVTEARFRAACDLAQLVGRTNLDSAYRLLNTYLQKVKHTGNRRWEHILLMGWAKSEMALGSFSRSDSLYRLARQNARPYSREYREALVASVLMCTEWEQTDSLPRYQQLGEQASLRAGDRESLSFLYTFKTMGFYARNQRDSMQTYFQKAIRLAEGLPDKNALFTARYNYANLYWRKDPRQQVRIFSELLALAGHPSLKRYPQKLYERTAFTFRNAGPSVNYQLAQLNLLLADYDRAASYARNFYNATVPANPHGQQAAMFNAEMAIFKAYQQKWDTASYYLTLSKKIFNKPEEDIPYPGYHIAAGMLAEHAAHYPEQLRHFKTALSLGNARGLYAIPPELYYAHALLRNKQISEAEKIFQSLPPFVTAQQVSAPTLYYYQYYAELQKMKGNQKEYVNALEKYYASKDSLVGYNRYRDIQEIQAKLDLTHKQQQIHNLHQRSRQLENDLRRERILYSTILFFATAMLGLLTLFLHARKLRNVKQQQIKHLQEVMKAEEKERARIAGELHNDVNTLLSLAILNVSSTLEKEGLSPLSRERLHTAGKSLADVSSTIRDLSHRLSAGSSPAPGFRQAIEQTAKAINISGKLHLELIIVGFEDTSTYPSTLLEDLQAIVHELLQNMLKHASAQHGLLELIEHPGLFSVLLEDDGIGIDRSAGKPGIGLKTIQQIIQDYQGTIEIRQKAENGTLVMIEIPVPLIYG